MSEKIQQILQKQSQLIEEQKYYEYEQKILTFGSRFINQENNDAATSLYLQASKILIVKGQDNEGFNLIQEIIRISNNLDAQTTNQIMSIYSIAQFSKQKIQLVNRVLNKITDKAIKEQVCQQVGIDLINQGKFHLAWRYLVNLKDVKTEIQMLMKWNETLYEREKQLNIIRYVLIKLGEGLIEESTIIVQELMPTRTTQEALFIHFLIKAIKIQSKSSYELLFSNFTSILNADPSFQDLYYRVGVKYFGLQEKAQNQNGLGGMLSQFFQ